jgi:hypothetical protein
VRLASGRQTAVIPDAYLVLAPRGELPVGIALELDRGTEDQKRWRQKVAAIAAWVSGPYQDAFGLDNLTVAVVTSTPGRVEQLTDWTEQELESAGNQALGDIFLFTSTPPVAVSPTTWFFGPIWQPLRSGRPVSLLDGAEGGALAP